MSEKKQDSLIFLEFHPFAINTCNIDSFWQPIYLHIVTVVLLTQNSSVQIADHTVVENTVNDQPVGRNTKPKHAFTVQNCLYGSGLCIAYRNPSNLLPFHALMRYSLLTVFDQGRPVEVTALDA